jgi:DNA-binding beta-propeller fold protein YncE
MKLFFIPRLLVDKERAYKNGITLVEVLLTVSILGLIMAAMVPFIRTVHTTWNLGDRKVQLQQNARVGLDTISRFSRQAARLMNVSDTGKGNFIKLKGPLDNQTIIFYHNIPGSPFYSGSSGLIEENDLVMATVEPNPGGSPIINNALLAKSLSNFEIYFKDKNGQLTGQANNVKYIDISIRVTDPENIIPDAIDIASSISIRSEVRMKPVWISTTNFVVELSSDIWISGFQNPASVSANPSTGECWVADTGNNRIKKLAPDGTVLLNRAGFSQPRSVSVNPSTGECWVADTGNNRIIKLSPLGVILENVSDFWQPNCVSVNTSTGECWVADTNKDRVRKVSPDGKILLTRRGLKDPMTVSVNPSTGECWVADTGNSRIKKLSADKGRFLLNLRGFNRPLALAVDYTNGECWVADTGNNQVIKLDAAGNEELKLSGFSSPSAISISP